MSDEYNITMDNVSLTNGAVINNGTINNTVNNAPASDAALLQDLADAQGKLADEAPKIAASIGELREAIEKKDQKTIGQKIAELSTGVAGEIVKSVAGAAAVQFLGLG